MSLLFCILLRRFIVNLSLDLFEKLLSLDLLLLLSLHLGSLLMVVGEVASLAHALGVEKSVMMLTISCVIISTELSIAGGAHVLGVVLSVWMWALSDLHNVVFSSTLLIINT